MKKLLSKILISVIMVAIFMAPISADIKINEIKAQLPGTNVIQYNGPDKETTAAPPPGEIIPANEYGCGLNPATWFTNCIALALYAVVFVPLAEITKLSAKILDFFVYYSTNSNSYTSDFVAKAWGAVRDIANIFFIVALLYVAIKTILGLNVTDNKKLIGSVIIIALIINFSLFTTKIVIDGSNMLAKVFYNNISSVDGSKKNADGTYTTELSAGSKGEKSISVGLVKQFNPHEIFVGKPIEESIGQFILVTLLSITMMGFMIYIFLSVALLFVARVVSLWLSMIFSPIAFISYTVPFEIPGFGHKEWWPDLIKNSLLAPLFIFFLYIIIMFGDFLKLITYDVVNSTDWLDSLMKTIIPFAIIFILLLKAKHLAVKYSGEIGAAVNKIGAMAGGLALGAATGGAAMLGRTALGGGGGYLAGQAAKGAEFLGLKRTAGVFKDVGKFAQKSSFDIRQTGAGKAFQKQTGMNLNRGFGVGGVGSTESLKGGWSEMKKQQIEKRQKRADELEKRETGKEKNEVADAEIKLKEATLPVKLKLEDADREIDKARKDLSDAAPSGKDAAALVLKAAKDAKEIIRASANGGAGLKVLETAVHEAKQKLDVKSDEITTTYAKEISGNTSKALNQIFKLGAYSRAGADEAARKIRTGTKLDSGEKPH